VAKAIEPTHSQAGFTRLTSSRKAVTNTIRNASEKIASSSLVRTFASGGGPE
jgi:hypothetical protein